MKILKIQKLQKTFSQEWVAVCFFLFDKDVNIQIFLSKSLHTFYCNLHAGESYWFIFYSIFTSVG